MISWTRLALCTCVMMGALAGSPTHSADQPSYVSDVMRVPQREPIRYQLSFVARFDERIVVDTGESGASVDDTVAGNGTLWDKESVQIGRFDANTRVSDTLKDGDRRLLWVTYTFGEGQDSIVILGAGVYAGKLGLMNQQVTNNFSIVGGTGKFLAAGGQCGITRMDQINYNLSCTAFVPDY
jgi:hypothetical protein